MTWGIIAGLLIGKVLGVTAATWLGLQTGLLRLPDEMQFVHVVGIGLLAGIGFTMSIFMTELAFGDYQTYILSAKTGILISSLLAGGLGIIWFRLIE